MKQLKMDLEACCDLLRGHHTIAFGDKDYREIEAIVKSIEDSPDGAYLTGVAFMQQSHKKISWGDFQTGILFGVCLAAVSGDAKTVKILKDGFKHAEASRTQVEKH